MSKCQEKPFDHVFITEHKESFLRYRNTPRSVERRPSLPNFSLITLTANLDENLVSDSRFVTFWTYGWLLEYRMGEWFLNISNSIIRNEKQCTREGLFYLYLLVLQFILWDFPTGICSDNLLLHYFGLILVLSFRAAQYEENM